jgi:hypothetical protein
LVQQSIDYYQKARDIGYLTNEEFKLKEIDVMTSYGEYTIAEDNANNLISELKQNRASPELLSDAYTSLGRTLFAQGEMKSAREAILWATRHNEENTDAHSLRNNFDNAQLSAIQDVASDEAKNSFRDLAALTGDVGDAGGFWQFASTSGMIIGAPFQTAHITGNTKFAETLFGPLGGKFINEVLGIKPENFDNFLKKADENINHADKIGLAAEQMKQLVDEGFDLLAYGSWGLGLSDDNSDYSNRFLAVYQANSYDDILPTKDLAEILFSDEFVNAPDNEKMDLLRNMLQEKGYDPNSPTLQKRFSDTLMNIALIDYATKGEKKDPTLASLMYGGEFVEVGDRLGEEVSLNTARYALLFAADIVLNPINLIGAGFAARAASGIKLGIGMGRFGLGAGASAQAWGSITAKNLAKAYLAEIIIDGVSTTSIMAIAETNPRLAQTIGLGLGVLAGSVMIGGAFRKVSKVKGVYSDLQTKGRFFVRSADDFAPGSELIKQFDSPPTTRTDGSLIGKIDGEDVIISVGTPDQISEAFEVNLRQRIAYELNDLNAKEGQRLLDDAVRQSKDSSSGTGTSQPGCFLENTKILMTDETYKNIQDIFIGDGVIAYDIFNNYPVKSEISHTFKRFDNQYYLIEYEVIV